jgi:hypothetical protein
MRMKQVRTTCWEKDALVAEGEDNLGYTPAGTDREVDPVATVPEMGGDVLVRGTVVPICTIQRRSNVRRGHWKIREGTMTHPC